VAVYWAAQNVVLQAEFVLLVLGISLPLCFWVFDAIKREEQG